MVILFKECTKTTNISSVPISLRKVVGLCSSVAYLYTELCDSSGIGMCQHCNQKMIFDPFLYGFMQSVMFICPFYRAKTLTLDVTHKFSNQILSYLPCLQAPLTSTIFHHFL